MISEKYVFEITTVKGNKHKIQWELSCEKAKQRYLSLKKNENFTEILVFKLSPQKVDTSDWSD